MKPNFCTSLFNIFFLGLCAGILSELYDNVGFVLCDIFDSLLICSTLDCSAGQVELPTGILSMTKFKVDDDNKHITFNSSKYCRNKNKETSD